MSNLRHAIILGLIWVRCAPALAQEGSPPPTLDSTEESVEVLEARELFLQGRKLLEQGLPAEACQPLERSQKLVPTIGTLLNLGMCHSHAGHLATAHDYYRQAEVLATLQRDARRREHAHNEAAALAARRATLTLRVPAGPDAELQVRVDGVVQPYEVWSNPMYIDAGEHRIAVQSSDEQAWQGSVFIVDGNKHVVVIPEFQPPPAASGARTELVSPAPASERAAPASSVVTAQASLQRDSEGLTTTQHVALGVGGAGLAALGASVVYTIAALSTYDDSSPLCRTNDVCTPKGVQLREDARAHATRATVLGIAGGVAVAGGVVLWFLGKPLHADLSETQVSISAGPDAITASITRPL